MFASLDAILCIILVKLKNLNDEWKLETVWSAGIYENMRCVRMLPDRNSSATSVQQSVPK